MTARRVLLALAASSLAASSLAAAEASPPTLFFDPAAPKHGCVDPLTGSSLPVGQPAHLQDVNTTYEEMTILLVPLAPVAFSSPAALEANATAFPEDGLSRMCAFHRWTSDLDAKARGEGLYRPLGRSIPTVPGERRPRPSTADDIVDAESDSSDSDAAGTVVGPSGDWNRPPGIASRRLRYDCGYAGNSGDNFVAGEYLCEVTLPRSSTPKTDDPAELVVIDAPYYLTYRARDVSVRNEIARFLEKNTFGPTKAEIDAMEAEYDAALAELEGDDGAAEVEANATAAEANATEAAAAERRLQSNATTTATSSNRALTMARVQASWISDQQNSTLHPPTSLRAYYRRRLNPRQSETYRIGESGPHPCEAHSRWRKFAFTSLDVENSRALRWGSKDLGGTVQVRGGHRVTAEPVQATTFEPSTSPTASFGPTRSSSPTGAPAAGGGEAEAQLRMRPHDGRRTQEEVVGPNILGFGDMEGATTRQIRNQWPSRCGRSLATDPVYAGEHSLAVEGGKRCFIMRPMAPDCALTRVSDPVMPGEVFRLSFKVMIKDVSDVVFQVQTAHYSQDKPGTRKWNFPSDDSHVVSRTKIATPNVWVSVEATHVVGPDWTFGGAMLPPARCNHYHLRFRALGSDADYNLDDVKLQKVTLATPDVGSAVTLTDVGVPASGFFSNPSFDLGTQFWKATALAPSVGTDDESGKGVAKIRRGNVLVQNVLSTAESGKRYRFRFKAKVSGTDAADFRAIVRLRFAHTDRENPGAVCARPVCNFFKRPVRTVVSSRDGEWQEVVSDEFDFFDLDALAEHGTISFVTFQLLVAGLPLAGEVQVTDFAVLGDDYTTAPSASLAPSGAPTNLVQEDVGYLVKYAGEVRTVVRTPFQVDATGEVLAMDGTTEYELCAADEVEGSKVAFPNRMSFVINGRCQPIRGGNPTVDLDPHYVAHSDLHVLDLSSGATVTAINSGQTRGGDWLLQTPVADDVCDTFPSPYDNDYRGSDPSNPDAVPSRFEPDKPVFAKLPDGTYALFDARLILHENSLESPKMDGGGDAVLRSTLRANNDGLTTLQYPNSQEYFVYNDRNVALCSNEQPNFVNQDSCVVSYEENVCVKEYVDASNSFNDVQMVVTFDDASLAKFHNATRASGPDQARYFYAVSNLRWDDTVDPEKLDFPCVPGNPVSRWRTLTDLDNSTCVNELADKSNAAFVHALESSNDENPHLRDVYLWNDKAEDGCDEADYGAYGMLVMTEEGCWENMHPDYMSIYDFTGYEARHPVTTTGVTYINNWTSVGILEYPDDHPMSHFEDLSRTILAVERYSYASTSRVNQGARYGDKIILDQFAEQVNLNIDALILKSLAKDVAIMTLANKVVTNRGGGTLVCGSPNEVAPDPTLDDYFDVIHRDLDCIGCQDSYGDYSAQKVTVWTMNALEAPDQLCQRMAWSMYELLNVGTASNPDNTESNLYTYDIFTRHCFGSYFDVLKELTYNPKMAEQFSFIGSTSIRLSWDVSGQLVFPDENYGREVMQLFTVGMHDLNSDGTETRDQFGRIIQTYNNYDIMSNARVFTGFSFTARRGNIEELFRSEKSRLDPLRIDVDKHDFFPKSALGGGWLGDRYPLCVDLPKYHFLKKGATYRFRGSSSLPRAHYNPSHWDSDESIKRFVLDKQSQLYQALCNPGEDGNCNFATAVTLESNLECFGKECRVDDLEVVQVAPGTFFEYYRVPCVDLSFYENPTKVITGFSPFVFNIGRRHTHAMCADPRAAVAARACCDVVAADRSQFNYDFEYHGERVVKQTNVDQCLADNGTVCDPVSMKADNPLVNIRPVYSHPFPSQNTFFWTDSNCTQSVKVREDGMVAIVNKPQRNPWFYDDTVPYVDEVNTVNFFPVPWEKDAFTQVEFYPSVDNSCGNGSCSVLTDGGCQCSISLSEAPVFSTMPTRDDVLSLKIGAHDPALFDQDAARYTLLESTDDVEVYVASNSGTINDTNTIFKVVDEFGEVAFFKNMISTITLGGSYVLRNPPAFMNLVGVKPRDAEYEVDAFLNHLIRYPSAPPFVAKKLIQYHGVSNPTPGFVERVSKAFSSGSFVSNGINFGSNKYGDLRAVAAAISLDPEMLSPVTDEDPVNGNIREPVLKVIQFMRSLGFERRSHIKFRHGLFFDMAHKIGQMVFYPPDQFSFFSHHYSPPGVFAQNELVSPESELVSMSSVVGLHNGLFSFVNFGLNHVDGGFGPALFNIPVVGDYTRSLGTITYPYQTNIIGNGLSDTIDELSTLMTSGRLSSENKQVLENAHAYFNEKYGPDYAGRVVLKLLVSLPEFHTSNTLSKTGSSRPITPPADKSSAPYRAIVYIHLNGGADSFNILSPGSIGCSGLYDDYFAARGGGAGIGLKPDEILNIDAASAQMLGCSTLGVTHLLPAYKDIFDEGKGIFFANVGHLHKPVDKTNWLTETRTDLFSHHTMRLESMLIDAFREGEGPGVLGRMIDILQGQGHAVGAIALNGRSPMVDGSPTTGRLSDVLSTEGLSRIFDRSFLKGVTTRELEPFLESLHADTDDTSGIFGDAWSQVFVDVWNKTDSLVSSLRGASLATDFTTPGTLDVGEISSQLKMVARLITVRNERGNGINRDVFYCEMGGFDAHSKLATVMENKLPSLNHAVSSFWAEIKAQGLEDNVVVIQGSEFGRTITPNSNQGSDHAWGGNFFMFGGDVKGGKLMGQYPKSFGDADPTNIGRGRLLPTTPWDALYYGLTQWIGITDQADIDYVLPNSRNHGCNLFTDYDLFNTGQNFLKGCGGTTLTTPITFQLPEARMLTGEEQKSVCRLAMRKTAKEFEFDKDKARCYISGQAFVDSVVAPGFIDVSASALLNFDGSIQARTISVEKIEAVTKAAAATASDLAVHEALEQSEAPSEAPSMQPSTSAEPTNVPSHSTQPSLLDAPSLVPSASFGPTVLASLSPSVSLPPSLAPSISTMPTSSLMPSSSLVPTPRPTDLYLYEGLFYSYGFGSGWGALESTAPASYTIQGRGSDIWSSSDDFHYRAFETSGDATFVMLIEDFDASNGWAKAGIMFRQGLTESASHYSLLVTGGYGLCNEFRSAVAGDTAHYGSGVTLSSIFLRVSKEGNVLRSYYKSTTGRRWIPFGAVLSMNNISSNGYFVGIAVSSYSSTAMATLQVSGVKLTRSCSSESMTPLQCDQASNCETGQVSGKCYFRGEVPFWESKTAVPNIFEVGSTITSFGCNNVDDPPNYAVDGSTHKYSCDRIDRLLEPTGLVVVPFSPRSSVAMGLRVYANDACPYCDPVSYKIEGRADSASSWVLISEGDIPWKTATTFPRNVEGLDISSTYASGDGSREFSEVTFSDEGGWDPVEYYEYKITWSAARALSPQFVQVAELEVFGLLGDEPPRAPIGYSGSWVNTIVPSAGAADTVIFGGYDSNGSRGNVIDRNTNKLIIFKQSGLNQDPGVAILPTHGKMSVVTGMRIYTANNEARGDPVRYKLQGRKEGDSLIRSGRDGKCWEVDVGSGTYGIKFVTCNGNLFQKFYLRHVDNSIRSRGVSGWCLDQRLDDGDPPVYMYPCHGGNNQKWTYDPNTLELKSFHDSSCLDHEFNLGRLFFHSCHGGNNQQFLVNEGFDLTLDSSWTDIDEGPLPWISPHHRNPTTGSFIDSSYESGDTDFYHMEVEFPQNTEAYMEYRVTFPEQRDSYAPALVLAEIELPGLLVEDGIVSNPGMENSLAGDWVENGFTLSRSSSEKRSGSWSLYATGRTQSWHGPTQALDLNVMVPLQYYHVSCWVKSVAATSTADVIFRVDNETDTQYVGSWAQPINSSSWTLVGRDDVMITLGAPLTGVGLKISGLPAGESFYVDDCYVSPSAV
ncbi:hypothetical protein ACHAWF_017328 [Thalassiosira exigua]